MLMLISLVVAIVLLFQAFSEDSCQGDVVIFGSDRPTLCLTDADIEYIKEMEWPKEWERYIEN